MRSKLFLLVALVLGPLATSLTAAPPDIKIPEKIEAKTTDGYVHIAPETDAKGLVFRNDSGLVTVPNTIHKDPRSILALTPKAGTFVFTVVGSTNDEITIKTVTVTITDPAPADLLAESIKVAYLKEPELTRGADAKKLAAVYRAVSGGVVDASVKTMKDMGELNLSTTKSQLDSRFTKVRAAFAEEFAKTFKGNEDSILSDTDKVRAAELFRRFASVCDGL